MSIIGRSKWIIWLILFENEILILSCLIPAETVSTILDAEYLPNSPCSLQDFSDLAPKSKKLGARNVTLLPGTSFMGIDWELESSHWFNESLKR